LSAVSKKWPMRELTPSVPKPILGHPNPVATTGGVANGMEAAEQYVIDNTGWVTLGDGGRRGAVASCVFSGMDRKEGMLYLWNYKSVICSGI